MLKNHEKPPCFFPTLTCGVFVFSSVSAPPPPPPLPPHSLTHSLTHSLPHSLTPSLPHSLTPSLTHLLTHLMSSHSLTPSLTHSLTSSLISTCTAKGSDVRPGVPPVSLGLRRFCVAGVGQRALPRGRMYALEARWFPAASSPHPFPATRAPTLSAAVRAAKLADLQRLLFPFIPFPSFPFLPFLSLPFSFLSHPFPSFPLHPRRPHTTVQTSSLPHAVKRLNENPSIEDTFGKKDYSISTYIPLNSTHIPFNSTKSDSIPLKLRMDN